MNIRKIEDLLNRITMISRMIEGQESGLSEYAGQIRDAVAEIEAEVSPPADSPKPLTRDQISPREWAEYEWHDATTMGDSQRKYIRGLKR
jgi:hypothetical protein